MSARTQKRKPLKIKREPPCYYVDIDLTMSETDIDRQIKALGDLMGWNDEEPRP